jgi:hypothetical protein
MSATSNSLTNQSNTAIAAFLELSKPPASTPPTPEPYADVPVLLKDIPHWIVWKLEKRDGKHTKVPYDAKANGMAHRAKPNDATTWTEFTRAAEVATDALSKYDGVGFMLQGTDLVGIDFDGVLHDGVAEPFVLDILKHLGNPYCEITPSGNGLRAFVQCATLPPGQRKFSGNKYGAEIYSGSEGGRYLTVTGNHFSGDGVPQISDISLAYLLTSKIRDDKFKRLWMGDLSDFIKNGDPDPSAGDMSLLDMLALAPCCKRDARIIEEFFNASQLGKREKWTGRKDYCDRSIKTALSATASKGSPTNIQSSRELEFHLPAVETGTHRDYVISPAPKQKDGWFPLGAVSLVGGPSGGSKTTWMLQLLLAQAIKVPFHGHNTYGRPYLMLGADRGEDAHKRTMDRMNLGVASVPFKPLPLAWDLAAAQGIVDQIEATVPLPEIVFIEGVDMLVTEVNNIKAVAYFVHALQKIAQHYRIAIIGSLGSPKVKEGHGYTATRDNLLGSGGWGRTVETVALLSFPKNDDTSGRRQLTVVLRNAPAEKFPLKFVDGLLEIDPDNHEEDDGVGQASEEIQWYQEQARLAKKDPTKKWWTIVDMERALNLKHTTADRHVTHDHTKKHLVRKPGSKSGRGSAAEYHWNESKTNPIRLALQKQDQVDQGEAF